MIRLSSVASFSRVAGLVLVAVAAVAFGADKAPDAKVSDDKKGVTINEIERGFYFEGRGGYWATINPPALAGSKSYFSSGQAAQLDLGFDIGDRVSPSLFLLATGNRMGSDYTGYSTGGIASGDYGAFIPGVGLKVRLVGFKDAQEVERTWFYVRAAGGVMFYSPSALIGKLDVMVSGGAGFEYFTKLRHFSIGIEANFNYMLLTSSAGFSVLPTVKYSF